MSGVAAQAVESRLAELRADAQSGGVRTNILDLVVYCDDEGTAVEMTELVSDLPFNRPSRAIVLRVAPDEEPEFDARVTCASSERAGRAVCSEVVSLRAPELAALPNLAASLLLPDLPVFLLWRGRADDGDALDAFWPIATRVVLDSTLEPGTLDHVPALIAREPRRDVTDLSWTKVTGWRSAVARLFDLPENARQLETLRGVVIRHAGGSDAQARLLAAWLLAQTGREPECLIAGEERPDMRSGSLTGVELECDDGRFVVERVGEGVARLSGPRVPKQNVRLVVPPLPTLVAHELEYFGRDHGFEHTVEALTR